MGWVSGVLAVVCLGTGLLHLVRLAVRRRDVAGELSHAAMGLGMAAMFSPLGNPVPGPVWTAVFVVCAAWFVTAWFVTAVLHSRSLGGEAAHHVVASGAMLFMLATGYDPAAPVGHAAHGGGASGALGLASVAALALTGYFAWHTLRCADRCRRPEPSAGAVTVRTRTLEAPHIAAAAQLVTAAAMAVMLLGMV